MSDRGGRGGSRGRGRGRGDHRGGHSDRGGSGDRGGFSMHNAPRGQYHGGRGDSRGRGDFRGGRGGRGDSRGGRGDFRGGRGGRGGGRGGRASAFEGDLEVWGQGSPVPKPDPAITQLENEILLSSNMKKLSVGKSQVNTFPPRPAFGQRGTPTVVWANYFTFTVNTGTHKTFCKYTIAVVEDKPKEEGEMKEKSPTKKGGKKPKKEHPGADPGAEPSAQTDANAVKGRKLRTIIEQALQQIGDKVPLATEFKSQVISLTPLDFPGGDHTIQVDYKEPGRDRTNKFNVTFSNAPPATIADLLTFLKEQTDAGDPEGQAFPKFEGTVDALDIIAGHTPRCRPDIATVGRGRFFPLGMQGQEAALGREGLVTLIRGFNQSVRPATGRLLINVNITHGIFRPHGSLANMIRQRNLNRMGGSMQDRDLRFYFSDLQKLQKVIGRSRINCQVPAQGGGFTTITKTIAGFARSSDVSSKDRAHSPRFSSGYSFGGPKEIQFFLNQPKTNTPATAGLAWSAYHTVFDYFQKRYGRILDQSLPLINTGTPKDPVYFPAEVCELVEGQPLKAKLTADQAQDMINFACRSPFKNAKSITEVGRETVLGLESSPLLKKFGISVGGGLITVHARQLPSPSVVYNRKQVKTDGASWNMRDVQVHKPGKRISRWTYIYFDYRTPHGDDLANANVAANDFVAFMIKMGINIEPKSYTPGGVTVIRQQHETFQDTFASRLKSAQARNLLPEFALVILPDKDTEIYNAVKNCADVDFGFHTVCVVRNKFLRRDPGQFANIALKWNLKAGGVNHQLQQQNPLISQGKTMIVGYDVIHPTNLATDREGLPSQVGLVASIDSQLGQWPAYYWNQPGGVEMLDNTLKTALQTRLDLWRAHNKGQLPENIVIFRDGVSEGQFGQVLDKELPWIREACRERYPAAQQKAQARLPRISIVVSVKRHATRFYPTDPAHMDAKSRNVRAGTVVDRGVTQARYWEFFLAAHAALQGTARPARYVVLLDEVFRAARGGAQAADALEQLTHDICYLYGRATKAVSICPPAYYADILCTRARVHMDRLFGGDDLASELSGGARTGILGRKVHDGLKDSMYYI